MKLKLGKPKFTHRNDVTVCRINCYLDLSANPAVTDNIIRPILKRFRKKSLKGTLADTITYTNGKLKFYSIGITKCHVEDQESYKDNIGESIALRKAKQKAYTRVSKIYEALAYETKKFADYNVTSFLYTSDQFKKHTDQEELKLYEIINEINT